MKSMDYTLSCHIKLVLFYPFFFKCFFFPLILFKWWVFNTFVDIVIYFIQFYFLFFINFYVCFNNGILKIIFINKINASFCLLVLQTPKKFKRVTTPLYHLSFVPKFCYLVAKNKSLVVAHTKVFSEKKCAKVARFLRE
jgi:hypothetical protein